MPIAVRNRWLWNELHTPDPAKALAFYEKVAGFSHRALDMGPGGVYHTLSKGGVDRGGATDHIAPGMAAHWLPYVAVVDTDATAARATRHGATMRVPPEDIPGVGRFAVFHDPAGALLAIMRPMPRAK